MLIPLIAIGAIAPTACDDYYYGSGYSSTYKAVPYGYGARGPSYNYNYQPQYYPKARYNAYEHRDVFGYSSSYEYRENNRERAEVYQRRAENFRDHREDQNEGFKFEGREERQSRGFSEEDYEERKH